MTTIHSHGTASPQPSPATATGGFNDVLQTLGVDQKKLDAEMAKAEAKASGLISQLSADGDFSAADKDKVAAFMADQVAQQLGVSNLPNNVMMALTEMCRNCLDGIEKQVASDFGVELEQGSFSLLNNLYQAPAANELYLQQLIANMMRS